MEFDIATIINYCFLVFISCYLYFPKLHPLIKSYLIVLIYFYHSAVLNFIIDFMTIFDCCLNLSNNLSVICLLCSMGLKTFNSNQSAFSINFI